MVRVVVHAAMAVADEGLYGSTVKLRTPSGAERLVRCVVSAVEAVYSLVHPTWRAAETASRPAATRPTRNPDFLAMRANVFTDMSTS